MATPVHNQGSLPVVSDHTYRNSSLPVPAAASKPGILGSRRNTKVVVIVCSVLAPVLLPFLHLGVVYRLWDEYARVPDRKECSCSCWDTIFKGSYASGISGYKHVYFNVTPNTFKIWAITVAAVITFYETVRWALTLTVTGRLRYSMACLLVSVIYPHYYSWWSYFNYWNDEFYSQWEHQLIFSTTELISTLLLVFLMNRDTPVTPRKLLIIVSIAVFHILTSGLDQFILNVIHQKGRLHQVLRDIGFMVPDLLHVALPLYELRQYAQKQKLSIQATVSGKELVASVMLIFFALVICRHL